MILFNELATKLEHSLTDDKTGYQAKSIAGRSDFCSELYLFNSADKYNNP